MEYMKATPTNYLAVAQFAESRGFDAWVDGPGTIEVRVTATGDRLPVGIGQYLVVEDGALRIEDQLPTVLDRCDPERGYHTMPHVGCVLR